MSRRRARGVPRDPRAELTPEIRDGADFLLAFFDTLERQRQAGEVLGWRVQRGPEPDVFCMLQVLTPFAAIEGSGKTWHEAHRALVDAMVQAASRGAPSA